MNLGSLYLLAVVAMFGPAVVTAEQAVIEISVESLCREYAPVPGGTDSTSSRIVFDPPSSISELRLRVVGTAVPGVMSCPDGPVDIGVPLSVCITESGFIGLNWAFEISLGPEETFDRTADLIFLDRQEVLSLVLGGRFDLYFFPNAGARDECTTLEPYAVAKLDSVILIVEGDFPLPGEGVSWGEIKASYR